jgi:hypothetical protein
MSEQVQVQISREIFEKLKRLAEPLVDDPSAVIDRLICHWEAAPPKQARGVGQKASTELWRSPRGDVLPVGEPLQGKYKGKIVAAVVARNGIRFEGKIFPTLSAAAIAAKGLSGTKGNAANTNGRSFWSLRDPNTNQWIPISGLRLYKTIDTD